MEPGGSLTWPNLSEVGIQIMPIRPHLLPAGLDAADPVPCRDCGFLVRIGVTHKGNPARFNVAAPHMLHAVTCPAAKQAKARLKAMRPAKPATNGVRYGKKSAASEKEQEHLEALIEATLRAQGG